MRVIFSYKGKAYNYCIIDDQVKNYEINEDPYQGLCDTEEEKESLDKFFRYAEEKLNSD